MSIKCWISKVQTRRINRTVIATVISLTMVSPLVVAADSVVNSSEEKKLLTGITQLDAGDRSAYASTADGTAWAFGGGYGSIGNGATTPAYTPVKMHIDHVKQISGGYRHNLMLKDDGTVWAVGGNEHGQLGTGTQSLTILVEPVQVKGLTDVISVSAGGTHSLALRKDGTVWAWGGNEQGQLGDNTGKNGLIPVQVKGLPSILSIAAGSNVNGKIITTDQKPVFINDSVYVPLRLISEMLGANVEWDADAYAVQINANK